MNRATVWDALRGDAVLNGLGVAADGSNVHQADTIDTLPTKPALVLRYGDTLPEFGDRTSVWVGAGTTTLQVWVHDDPSDFARIDSIIDRIRTVLSGLRGGGLIQCDWTGDSGELRDDGYRTITRHSDWRLAQGWR